MSMGGTISAALILNLLGKVTNEQLHMELNGLQVGVLYSVVEDSPLWLRYTLNEMTFNHLLGIILLKHPSRWLFYLIYTTKDMLNTFYMCFITTHAFPYSILLLPPSCYFLQHNAVEYHPCPLFFFI